MTDALRHDRPGPETEPLRSTWRRPVIIGIGLLTGAVLIALTAPTSADPPQRVGLAIVVGGAVVTALSARDRRWIPIVAGLASVGVGTLLLVDGDRFTAQVARVGGGLVMLGGLAAARFVARRTGRAAGAAVFVFAAASGALFVAYDRLLLPLVPGVLGAFGVALAVVGVVRASGVGELTPGLKLRRTVRLGVEAIGDRAATGATDPSVRDRLLFEGPERRRRLLRFLILMGFASAIASLGILADSTAVVIGAMLVAPLLTPLMGMSLSLVTGETASLRDSGVVAGAGVAVSAGVGFAVSAIVGRGTDVTANTQILTRTSPTLLDLYIAIAAGAAGAFAISRRDVADALPGVAVAIALVPPLAVVGITAQLGATDESIGALVLFGTNAVAILVTGAVTFFLTGVAQTDTEHRGRLEWWTIAFAGVAIVVLGALVANTTATDELGIRSEIAARIVDDWVGTRDYVVESVDVADDTVEIVVAGPGTPDDTDTLAESLARALDDAVAVDLTVSVTEQVTIESDADE